MCDFNNKEQLQIIIFINVVYKIKRQTIYMIKTMVNLSLILTYTISQ